VECNSLGAEVSISSERGHPVRQRAQRAQLFIDCAMNVRASRSGGQDVRAPWLDPGTDLLQFALSKSPSDLIKNLELVFPKAV